MYSDPHVFLVLGTAHDLRRIEPGCPQTAQELKPFRHLKLNLNCLNLPQLTVFQLVCVYVGCLKPCFRYPHMFAPHAQNAQPAWLHSASETVLQVIGMNSVEAPYINRRMKCICWKESSIVLGHQHPSGWCSQKTANASLSREVGSLTAPPVTSLA